jgi:selenocysteine lyase/cysteine desulfurase
MFAVLKVFVLLLVLHESMNQKAPNFGREMKEKEFSLSKDGFHSIFKFSEIFVQHGSYGATPRKITNHQKELITKMEENPLKFMSAARKLVEESIESLSTYVNVNQDDLVILESSTNAFNTIVKSLPFDEKSTVMYTNFEYGMIVVFLSNF